jgi:hypothetical protein
MEQHRMPPLYFLRLAVGHGGVVGSNSGDVASPAAGRRLAARPRQRYVGRSVQR